MIRSNKIVMLGTSVVALLAAVAGCAAESSDDNTGFPVATGGFAPGTGGAGVGTGGYPVATGGTAPGAGGLTPGAGGFTPGAGGTTPGAGGTTTTPVACTSAATLDGYLDNGKMCGYAWTAANKDSAGAEIAGTSISPPCGPAPAVCFKGNTICATGTSTIPANNAAANAYSGIMIGWNVAQDNMGGPNTQYTPSGTGITVNFTATGATGEKRVILQTTTGDYCAVATSGTALSWSSFKKECWTGGAMTAYDNSPIKAVMVQINGTDAEQSVSAFCLDSVTNN